MMNRPDTSPLLRRFVRDRDEDAFRDLVANYFGLVHSTALRRLSGDEYLARDVTQIVFTNLARQAPRLSSGMLIGSWLYQNTCFVSSKILRTEQRRLAREKEASLMLTDPSEPLWTELAPHLDDAMLQLSANDRSAILLRYFENQPHRAIAALLNISEDAAQKRVERALEKLRSILHAKGVSVATPALATLLLSKSVLPSSAAAIAAVTSAALASATQLSLAAITTALMSKITLLLTAIGLAGLLAILISRTPKQSPRGAQIQSATARANTTNSANAVVASSTSTALSKIRDLASSTKVDQILNQLETGLQGINEDEIDRALMRFWTQYDASSPEDQFQLRRGIPQIIALWKNASIRLKDTIVNTLVRFKPATAEMVDLYIEALSFQNEKLTSSATAGLMRAGPLASKAVDKLIEQLRMCSVDDSSRFQRSTAVMSLHALANIGPSAASAVPLLQNYLRETNKVHRIIGARAYWRITGDTQTVLPILTDALRSENDSWAADILGEMGPLAYSAIPDLQATYRDGPQWLKVHAYEALRSIAPTLAPDPAAVVDGLKSERYIEQMHAARLLWEQFRNSDQVLPTLIQLAGAVEYGMPKPEVEPALQILAEIGPAAEQALPAIRKLLETSTGHEGVWIAATNAWRQIAPGAPIPSKNK
jgi:RNA polymerase sigma factor (sigma-70 family)